MSFTIAAFGALLGNPVAAAARRWNRDSGSGDGAGSGDFDKGASVEDVQMEFEGVWWFAGSVMLLAATLILLARFWKLGWTWKGKM